MLSYCRAPKQISRNDKRVIQCTDRSEAWTRVHGS